MMGNLNIWNVSADKILQDSPTANTNALQFDGTNDLVTFGKAIGPNGKAMAGPTWPMAKFGTGLSFTATSLQYITFGNNSQLGLSSFTLEVWVKWTGSGATAQTGGGGVTAIPVISHG
jgi:hypothetical protein